MKITKSFLKNFEKNPLQYLSLMSNDDIANLIQKANYDYHTLGKPSISDDVYDMAIDALEKRDPENPILFHVGAVVQSDRKVTLPYWMGSMDKIKADQKTLDTFLVKYKDQFVMSEKLDGVSALVVVDTDQKVSMFTRGDGGTGQDISHLIPFIDGNMDVLPSSCAVRGELIIAKASFEKYLKNKGANARNLVSGQVNAKIPDLEVCRYIQFLAYNVYNPPNLDTKKQFEFLTKRCQKTPYYQTLDKSEVNVENLSKLLIQRRRVCEFEIDGLIIAHNQVYPLQKNKNPGHAFAFKNILTSESAEVIVTNVEWNISKDGYMKPVVEFEPVHLNGVTIKRATGFNAGFIVLHKIGPGARALIVRSGDVIPYIQEITQPSPTGPSLPDKKVFPYVWNETMVDIMIEKHATTNNLKQLQNFFKVLGTKGVSDATIKKLYDGGYTSIPAYKKMSSPEALLSIPGIKLKSAQNIYESIKNSFESIDCTLLMEASNKFGRGFAKKRLDLIITHISDIHSGYTPSLEELCNIPGIEMKTAVSFLKGLTDYRQFVKDNDLDCNIPKKGSPSSKKKVNKYVAGKTFVFSGFRDAKLEQLIVDNQGKVSTTVSKNTDVVIVKDFEKESSKVTKAKALNIEIMLLKDFETKI